MDEFDPIRRQLLLCMMEIGRISAYLASKDIDDRTAVYLGVTMATAARYGMATTQAINSPTTPQPPIGRRCIFY